MGNQIPNAPKSVQLQSFLLSMNEFHSSIGLIVIGSNCIVRLFLLNSLNSSKQTGSVTRRNLVFYLHLIQLCNFLLSSSPTPIIVYHQNHGSLLLQGTDGTKVLYPIVLLRLWSILRKANQRLTKLPGHFCTYLFTNLSLQPLYLPTFFFLQGCPKPGSKIAFSYKRLDTQAFPIHRILSVKNLRSTSGLC